MSIGRPVWVLYAVEERDAIREGRGQHVVEGLRLCGVFVDGHFYQITAEQDASIDI